MKAGRHRSFDKDIALEKAMDVFWTNGYPGTSLTDLTTAMGINKPSLYSAFGNKEGLFNDAIDRFVNKYGSIHAQYLFATDKNLNERLQSYLTSMAKMQTDPTLPGGCFVCTSTSEMGGACFPTEATKTVTKINELTKNTLVEFFKAEISQGNINGERSALLMANYLMTIQFGLAVMARDGAGMDELSGVIKQFISKF